MIGKNEFKITIGKRRFRIGGWQIVSKKEFDADPERIWKDLIKRVCDKNKFRNFKDIQKNVEDKAKVYGKKVESKEYMIGVKVECEYKDYKGYLLEQREKLIQALQEINNILGIK